jgi:thiamine biosynthesis lipoprotein
MTATIETVEQRLGFACFGSECTVIVADGAARQSDAAAAAAAAETARRRLLEWHDQFSRFLPDSELTRLNEDAAATVPVTPMMRRVVQACVQAACATAGLVDPTLVGAIESAGYDRHLEPDAVELADALKAAQARRPAAPSPAGAWRAIQVDRRTGTVTRPPGVRIDPGGIAKGVFADELSTLLVGHDAFVVDCGGDMRLGGMASQARAVHVASPFDDSTLHTFEIARGAVATSGIGRRGWWRADGRPAHHLLDPATGEPAFTGIVQATALASTATEAETLSKAAILSGPDEAPRWLAEHGGLVVFDDGSYSVFDQT